MHSASWVIKSDFNSSWCPTACSFVFRNSPYFFEFHFVSILVLFKIPRATHHYLPLSFWQVGDKQFHRKTLFFGALEKGVVILLEFKKFTGFSLRSWTLFTEVPQLCSFLVCKREELEVQTVLGRGVAHGLKVKASPCLWLRSLSISATSWNRYQSQSASLSSHFLHLVPAHLVSTGFNHHPFSVMYNVFFQTCFFIQNFGATYPGK